MILFGKELAFGIAKHLEAEPTEKDIAEMVNGYNLEIDYGLYTKKTKEMRKKDKKRQRELEKQKEEEERREREQTETESQGAGSFKPIHISVTDTSDDLHSQKSGKSLKFNNLKISRASSKQSTRSANPGGSRK